MATKASITTIMAEAITDGVIIKETTRIARAMAATMAITVVGITSDSAVGCAGWLPNQLDVGCLVLRSLVGEVSASSRNVAVKALQQSCCRGLRLKFGGADEFAAAR